MKAFFTTILCIALFSSSSSLHGVTVRVRDIAFPLGAQNNQLWGIGIVTGLAGDGDKDPVYTLQGLANVFQEFGMTIPAQQASSKNVAIVMVTANIGPFLKPGNTINVTVSAMGDAKSLQGGVLSMTPLFGIDKKVYATAQGPLSVGGFSLGNAGAGGANVQKNHPTTGQIISGGIVTTEIPVNLVEDNTITWVLQRADFTTAARMAEAINAKYPSSSHAESATSVRVKIPDTYLAAHTDFIAQLQAIEVQPDTPARIIINERTGTIVASARVKISSCAISHGNIVVNISETLEASQPNAFAPGGQTVVTPTTNTQVTEDKGRLYAFPEMPTVEKVAEYLNKLGATPRDMMAIFQAMEQAGALQAELIIQ